MANRLNKAQRILLRRARERHPGIRIRPIATRKGFSQAFTTEEGRWYLWYDTLDESSHVLREEAMCE